MLKFDVTASDIEELYRLFMEHPNGLIKKRLHVVYLKALGLPHQDIIRIARVSGDSVTRYVRSYRDGGVKALCTTHYFCPTSALLVHRDTLLAHFKNAPPNTVAQAAHTIESLTGITLALSACRHFLRQHLGMSCRKMGVIPAKADPVAQRTFLQAKLEPMLAAEQQGQRRVFFVDAAHFVMGAFLSWAWCCERVFLKTSSGRKRYNVLGAYSVQGAELITVTNDAYINSDTLVELLTRLRQRHPDIPVSLVLDNARYQRCEKVIAYAKALAIDLEFLPPYSPNLNLIERLWRFVKKTSLYNRYYEFFAEFRAAIDDCLDNVGSTFRKQVQSLLNPKFQLFEIPLT